ncbi:hypothetical protein [Lelliottia nimipressuralis]
MNFITVLLFAVSGGMTLLASRLIKLNGAGDDVSQFVYPLIAIISLWLSTWYERWQKNKDIKSHLKNEREKWKSVLKEVKNSKDELISRVINRHNEKVAFIENRLTSKITEVIEQQLPFKEQLTLAEIKFEAVSRRVLEVLDENSIKEARIVAILQSKGILDRKIADFIRLLREFHNDMNHQLMVTDSKGSDIWPAIEKLARDIFSQINDFDKYISTSLIEENEKSTPMNRKLSFRVAPDENSSRVDFMVESLDSANKKESNIMRMDGSNVK